MDAICHRREVSEILILMKRNRYLLIGVSVMALVMLACIAGIFLRVAVRRELIPIGNDLGSAILHDAPLDEIKRIYEADATMLYDKTPFAGTAFDVAIQRIRLDVVDYFLREGYDPNQQMYSPSAKETTPLGWAAYISESKEAVELLMAHGADPTLEVNGGKSALQLARDAELDDIVRILEDSDAAKQSDL